jgi:hypothetical protein
MKKSREIIIIVAFVVLLGILMFVREAIQETYGPIRTSMILGVTAVVVYLFSRKLSKKTKSFIGFLMIIFASSTGIAATEERGFNFVSEIGILIFGGAGLLLILTQGEKEEKLKQENSYRNALMLFPKTVENVTNIITKHYPVTSPRRLKFEVAVFVLYTLGESPRGGPNWFCGSIITYISDNIKPFTKEEYEKKWQLYNNNAVDPNKHDYKYYSKFDTLFSLIKYNIKDEIEPKIFKNEKNPYKAYLPIDSILEEIWKLEHIID